MKHIFVAMVVAVAFAGCANTSSAAHHPRAQRRFVTLVPSLAEDFVAVGAGSRLVGVSRFTDAVPDRVPRVGDFRSIDVEKIVALRPDVVVGIASQAHLLEPLRRLGVRVELLRDDTYDDIFFNIREAGRLSGRDTQAEQTIATLRRETAALHARTRKFRHRPTVFFALGTGPIWTAGPTSYMGHLIDLAGGRDAARLAAPWGQFSEEALVRAQPDAIISDNETDLGAILRREPWRSLRAVREGHVFTITNPQVVNALFRPGPHYNEGLRWLIERLTPLGN